LFALCVLWRRKGSGSMRRKLMSGANRLQLETGGVISRDSAFDFDTGSFTRRLPSVVKRARRIDY
jgi:hypothetical protein